jgi:hypothetical protein
MVSNWFKKQIAFINEISNFYPDFTSQLYELFQSRKVRVSFRKNGSG